jgi:surface antigen/uncharacterized protein (DUF433 family)
MIGKKPFLFTVFKNSLLLFLFWVLVSFISRTTFLNSNFSDNPKIVFEVSKKDSLDFADFLLGNNCYLFPNLPPYFIPPKVFAQIVTTDLPNNDILIHRVEKGETLSTIAKKYNLKVETIAFANNLEGDQIKPGQELIILPVDGVLHIVQKGENLQDILKKYGGDLEEVLAFNGLTSPDDIFEQQLLIIPGGKIPQKPKPTQLKFAKVQIGTNNYYDQSYSYPYGYCTWWVAQKVKVPNLGNAKDWLINAQAKGYSVCFGANCQPQVGAVVSLRTRHSLGHVAYVEDIRDGKIIISEMNYAGWGVVTKRALKIGDPRILGYIYP